MFEGILKAFKKKLEESHSEPKVVKEDTPVQDETEEPEEFDILSYVEKHGIEDKDSKKETPPKTVESPRIKTKKRKNQQNKSTIEETFAEEVMYTSDSSDEILAYVERYGVYNKDSSGVAKRGQKQSDGSVYKVKRAMEKRIDLHGLTVDEAESYLRRTIDEAKAVGITQLLVVHGRGMHSRSNGGADVIRQRVRELLSREFSHLVESYKYASGAEGGDGATRVFLK